MRTILCTYWIKFGHLVDLLRSNFGKRNGIHFFAKRVARLWNVVNSVHQKFGVCNTDKKKNPAAQTTNNGYKLYF